MPRGQSRKSSEEKLAIHGLASEDEEDSPYLQGSAAHSFPLLLEKITAM